VLKLVNVNNIEIKELSLRAKELSNRNITYLSHKLMLQKQSVRLVVNQKIEREENNLRSFKLLTQKGSLNVLGKANGKTDLLVSSLNSLRPENVLKRGFSITLFKGKSIRSIKGLSPDDEIETILNEGRLKSWVKKIQKDENF
jgi:exodeoxyribonuclease VII large subunit